MRNPFHARGEQENAKPELATTVEDVAESSSLEKEIGRQSKSIDGGTPAANEPDAAPAIEYVTGWKLWSMLVSIASVFILVLLDMSIVATVSTVLISSINGLRLTC
jgi:hypothetical protein